MPRDERPERKELLPDADPELVQELLRPAAEELDPDDPEAVWLHGDDPEADTHNTADRRSQIRRQMFSTGCQFVLGIAVAFLSIGLVVMAITNPYWQYIVPAAIVAPLGFWFFRVRWRKWLGSAPYFYRLLTSLGEDADNVLQDHRRKQRAKYAKKVGTLYGDPYADQALDEDDAPLGDS